MQVPRRRGDYRKPKEDPYLTEDKINELKEKLERLKKVTRFKLMKEVSTHAENGDFSENASYQIAKGKLRGVNQAIIEIEEHLKQAILIKPNMQNSCVKLGSKVTVEMEGKVKTWLILGSSEVNLAQNIISHNSPIGDALMDKKVGDTVKIPLKNKLLICKILKIE
ncbi:MAG: GreA/GreB family elongation factor [Candidatus Falkowbacteria bacterium]|nr:GreA/GreB family elongation factor [Candidatus Falkowbacteria bacterium]